MNKIVIKYIVTLQLIILPMFSFADNSSVEVGFSPSGTSLPLVLKVINQARSSLCVAAYSFTSRPIAQAISEAHRRGVKIQIVADEKSNSGKYTATTYLANQGINVRLNNNYAIMHNKFMVIDKQTVQTGSFNYSQAAVKKNAENVIVIWNNKDVALTYQNECNRLFNEAAPLAKKY